MIADSFYQSRNNWFPLLWFIVTWITLKQKWSIAATYSLELPIHHVTAFTDFKFFDAIICVRIYFLFCIHFRYTQSCKTIALISLFPWQLIRCATYFRYSSSLQFSFVHRVESFFIYTVLHMYGVCSTKRQLFSKDLLLCARDYRVYASRNIKNLTYSNHVTVVVCARYPHKFHFLFPLPTLEPFIVWT